MIKGQRLLVSMMLSAFFLSGTTFASAEDNSVVNTPNVDFNDIGNALVISGAEQTITDDGSVLVGNPGDPTASYSGETGNWVYYRSSK